MVGRKTSLFTARHTQESNSHGQVGEREESKKEHTETTNSKPNKTQQLTRYTVGGILLGWFGTTQSTGHLKLPQNYFEG